MKRLLFLVPIGALLFAPAVLPAQSALNGTWKVDMNKVDWSKKPDVFLLQNGMYSCSTCTPPIKIKADGNDQPVTGHPYINAMAVKVVNDHEPRGRQQTPARQRRGGERTGVERGRQASGGGSRGAADVMATHLSPRL